MGTIAINAWFLKHPTSGTGRCLKNLLSQLIECDRKNHYLLFTPPHNVDLKYGNTVQQVICDYGPVNDSRERWTAAFHEQEAVKHRFDILHYPSVPTPVLKGDHQNLFTVHDIIPLVPFSSLLRKNLRYLKMASPALTWQFMKMRRYFNTNPIITVSENNKQDLYRVMKLTHKNIFTVPNGVSSNFKKIVDRHRLNAVRKKYELPDAFVMYIGGLMIRKNVAGVIRAFARLPYDMRQKYPLLIFGEGFQESLLRRLIKKEHIEDTVFFRPFAEEADLPAIYSCATLVCYISWYEGFGLPILEAMACGTPLITSNVSSMAEIAGKSAFTVDPFDIDEIKAALHILLTNKKIQHKFSVLGLNRAKDFSWKKNAVATIKIYNRFS